MNDGNKVTFSPEFIEKTKSKKISRKKKAYLMKLKFESLTQEKLGKARTISDIMAIMGMKKNDSTGRKYINKLIADKKIIEYPTDKFVGPVRANEYYLSSSHPDSIKTTHSKPEKVFVDCSGNFKKLTQEELSSVHTRKDFALKLGYNKDQLEQGSAAVRNLIKTGLVKEEVVNKIGRKFIANYTKVGEVIKEVAEETFKVVGKISISWGSTEITIEEPTPEVVAATLKGIKLAENS